MKPMRAFTHTEEGHRVVQPTWNVCFHEIVRHDVSREGEEKMNKNVKTMLIMFSKHVLQDWLNWR